MPALALALVFVFVLGRTGMGNVTEIGVVYKVCSLPVLPTDGGYPALPAEFTDGVLSFPNRLVEEGKADMEGVEGVSNGSSTREP